MQFVSLVLAPVSNLVTKMVSIVKNLILQIIIIYVKEHCENDTTKKLNG